MQQKFAQLEANLNGQAYGQPTPNPPKLVASAKPAYLPSTAAVASARHLPNNHPANLQLVSNTKVEQDWKITLFDAVKAGRIQDVEKLMDANQVIGNLENPQNKGETILIAATLIKDNDLRTKMIAAIKKRVTTAF